MIIIYNLLKYCLYFKKFFIDHITSPTAIVMPIRRLIALCQEHNVLSMIDGAHAPGQLPLNLEEINADFYTGKVFALWGFFFLTGKLKIFLQAR